MTLPHPGRILALDVGDKRIGLALSDELRWTAQPLMVLNRKTLDDDICAIVEQIKEHQVTLIVVGVPIGLSEQETPQTQKVRAFMKDLQEATPILVETWDEALTSKDAEEVLIRANMSRGQRKKVVDKMAAALILQSYLRSKEKL